MTDQANSSQPTTNAAPPWLPGLNYVASFVLGAFIDIIRHSWDRIAPPSKLTKSIAQLFNAERSHLSWSALRLAAFTGVHVEAASGWERRIEPGCKWCSLQRRSLFISSSI